MSGAFSGLDHIIRRRLNQQPVGFRSGGDIETESAVDPFEMMKKTKTEDLLTYGFESEFVGRMPVVITLNDLDIDGLFEILKNDNSSVILGKKRDFEAYGIRIHFEDEALYEIARRAFDEHTGARGLVSVVDRLLLKFEKSLPDTELSEFTVTRELIENPEKKLQDILNQYYIKNFQKRFLASNGIVITFTQDAIDLISKKCAEQGKTFDTYCADMLRDYEYGLRLLDCDEFTVTRDIVENPKERLERLIKDAYNKK